MGRSCWKDVDHPDDKFAAMSSALAPNLFHSRQPPSRSYDCVRRGVRSDVQLSCTEIRFKKCSQSGKNGSKHPMLSKSMPCNVISALAPNLFHSRQPPGRSYDCVSVWGSEHGRVQAVSRKTHYIEHQESISIVMKLQHMFEPITLLYIPYPNIYIYPMYR